jgi:site-specific DNA-methyltransferase (adenine-specific)
MNPPYGRAISGWIEKTWLEVSLQNAARVVCLLPARTDTRWWHDYVLKYAARIVFIRGRVKFEGAAHNAPFPSAIVVFDRLSASDTLDIGVDDETAHCRVSRKSQKNPGVSRR